MSKEKKEKSNIVFLHDVRNASIINGKKIVHEEYVINGPKGLLIKFYHKENDVTVKYVIKALDANNFKFKSMIGEKVSDQTYSKDDLLNELKKHKDLKFALDYIKTQKGGAKVSSKGASKKKVETKTTQKKGSKKGSKSKRGSK